MSDNRAVDLSVRFKERDGNDRKTVKKVSRKRNDSLMGENGNQVTPRKIKEKDQHLIYLL